MKTESDVLRHQTSLAIWDVPSPLVRHHSSKIKVGVKCSAGCCLAGQSVEIRNETGVKVGGETLGQTPWDGTSALYWAEIELPDPANDGTCSWSANFTSADMRVPHEGASLAFSFLAVKPAEHAVMVRVIEKNKRAGLENAEVRLGVYKVRSDRGGWAKIGVPTGTYELTAWKTGYSAVAKTVEVAGSVDVEIEVVAVPEAEAPYWM
jgi:hypothetical protein